MKKYLLCFTFILFTFSVGFLSAIPKNKAVVGLYLTPLEKPLSFDLDKKTKNEVYSEKNSECQFGGAFVWADIIQGNKYVTAAGKIYYRLNSVKEGQEEQHKLDLKRAYVKIRPTGNDLFEVAAGKLYSYYLPGAFFNLAEIYTGNNRWGKTGLGTKFELAGFTWGLAMPVTESYVNISDSFALAQGFSYDFSHLNENLPLTAGFTLHEDFSDHNFSSDDFAFSASLYFTPDFTGFISRVKAFLSYSYNAEPYVASSVFKNVANYSKEDLKKAHLISLNTLFSINKVAFVWEGEAGHSVNGKFIPLYSGFQALIPLTEHIALKPRFFYYAAFDYSDFDCSRQTYELYPRLWLTFGKCNVSAGAIFSFMQIGTDKKDASKSNWYFGWEVPLYVEWKF